MKNYRVQELPEKRCENCAHYKIIVLDKCPYGYDCDDDFCVCAYSHDDLYFDNLKKESYSNYLDVFCKIGVDICGICDNYESKNI